MAKYRFILIPVILLLLGVFAWCTSMLFINLSGLLSNTGTDSELNIKTNRQVETLSFNEQPHDTDNRNSGYYETIEETITRIKRDVIVTGTITGVSGQESALFQIEGMEDRAFLINTQLMDGFIIKEITNSYVVLKNQVGNETFSLYVQSENAGGQVSY